MQDDIRYTDLDENWKTLTDSELQWFKSVCNDCLAATGMSVPIYCDNHYNKYKGARRNAVGITHTNKPEAPLYGDSYITIASDFIHDCYEEKFNHVQNLWFEDIEHVIAHELAHLYQWRHCKRHTKITEYLYGKIKEYQSKTNEITLDFTTHKL